jgi:isopentenyl phosphate kinase
VQILKLGGSVVTHKDSPFTAHTENIRRLAREIYQTNDRNLIILHGGGSFGHPLAKKFKIKEGYHEHGQLVGFSNSHIVNTFLNEDIPAVSVSPSSTLITDGGRIKNIDFKVITKFLEEKFIPVLYGDAVLDSKKMFTILSGDQLVVKLATELKAKRVILGSDVDGVFNSDPKVDPKAKLLERLSLSELRTVNLSQSQNTDVTGGMQGKILEMRPAIEQGIEVTLVNANEPSRIYRALIGEPVIGTVLTR